MTKKKKDKERRYYHGFWAEMGEEDLKETWESHCEELSEWESGDREDLNYRVYVEREQAALSMSQSNDGDSLVL